MKTVWRVFAYLKRYPWLAAGTLACAILGTLMVIVFPSVTKWIIDDVVRANRPDKLLPLDSFRGWRFSGSTRFQFAPDHSEQHVRAEESFSICAAICIRTFNSCRCAGLIIAPRAI